LKFSLIFDIWTRKKYHKNKITYWIWREETPFMFNHPRVSKDLIVGGIHASINTLIYIGVHTRTHTHTLTQIYM
jgi:hypothetical protein